VSALSDVSPGLRLLAVHAHPDDEASKGAATTAKYAAEGVSVLVATLTGGERGDVLNPKLTSALEGNTDLATIRQAEMAAAAKVLGVEHRWLGFVDSGLPDNDEPLPDGSFATLDPVAAAGPVIDLIREFRPHVVTTYDEGGGYPHPDHIQAHKVTLEAVFRAGDPDFTPPGATPWRVPKVYYDRGFSVERLRTLHEAMLAAGLESPYGEWLANPERTHRSAPITTRIEVADFFDRRDDALRAHATQVDPEGWFFIIPREIERSVWPWEEFELAHSTVEVTIPETDLFAGLR
jgi:mycothiol S-conjugate amidase